jgi:hypothetical protein
MHPAAPAPSPAVPLAPAAPGSIASSPSAGRGAARLRVAAITLLTAGAGALIAGGVLEGLAQAANAQLERPALGWVFDPGVETRRDTFHAAAVPLLSIGGAAVGVGAVVGVVAIRKARQRR